MKEGFEGIAFRDICQLFGKSRQAWYDIEQRHTNNRLQQELILQWVAEIRTILPRAGGIKLYKMLKDRFLDHNIKMGRDGVIGKYNYRVFGKQKYTTIGNNGT
jgi:hypothetical protein